MQGQLSRAGYTIHFESSGVGPRLIWVDPALGSSSMRPMQEALAGLAERFEVVTYDRRGRGRNESADIVSATAEVDDLLALVEHVGGTALIAGFSSGAGLVLHAAGQLPAATVVLVEPAVAGTPDESGLRESVQRRVADGDLEGAVREFYEATGTPEEIIQGLSDSPVWGDVVRCAPTLIADIDLTFVDDDVLAAVQKPVHVIVSDGSPPEITGMGTELAARVHAPVWREPGGWHGVDASALCARLVALD